MNVGGAGTQEKAGYPDSDKPAALVLWELEPP